MRLLSIEEQSYTDQRVIVRGDLDVDVNENNQVVDDTRLAELLPTLQHLFQKGAKQIILIGHRGRPEGQVKQEFSLNFLTQYFAPHFQTTFIPHVPINEMQGLAVQINQSPSKLVILENLRFYQEEENNDPQFGQNLATLADSYVNESFATSHRAHASFASLPQAIKQKEGTLAAGLHLLQEVAELSKVREASRPLVSIISGLKQDKLDFLDDFIGLSDHVLIAGRLPEFIHEDYSNPKVIVAKLNPDKEDITIHSIEQFEATIQKAATIFVSGPIGKFEEEGHLLGTKRVFQAIAQANAYKVAGGGDTTAAINALSLKDSFNWVSTGGGASLEFVAKGTLPGIELLKI